MAIIAVGTAVEDGINNNFRKCIISIMFFIKKEESDYFFLGVAKISLELSLTSCMPEYFKDSG